MARRRAEVARAAPGVRGEVRVRAADDLFARAPEAVGDLSVATVKTHISRLLDKLDRRDRAQLVVVAYETGVVVLGQR